MNIISLFSGCGGMDLGFENAGFTIRWANDNAHAIRSTYNFNFPNTYLETKSLSILKSEDIPNNIVGIIGGPPCQAWSVAGNGKGFNDKRGKLFLDFIRVINDKKPLFFVAENVEGLLSKRNKAAYEQILLELSSAGDGYEVSVKVVNANDYGVAQNRKRVIFVGYHTSLNKRFEFPEPLAKKPTVKETIWDLSDNAIPTLKKEFNNRSNGELCNVPNHEYWLGDYTYIFMSRNRVLTWDAPSYTIQASGRQTSIHPNAPLMIKVQKDVMKFDESKLEKYRRLSVRECARLQSFPDNFRFIYDSVDAGYKMVGNSVPVNLAYHLGVAIHDDLLKAGVGGFIEQETRVCV